METEHFPAQGTKYLRQISPLLERLRDDNTQRDRAGNRDLRYDRYAMLMLLYFFNPTLTSLRSLQQVTKLDKVQRITGGGRVSLAALSEAQHVFDPARLRQVMGELAAQVPTRDCHPDHAALRNLIAVDGTLLRALPRMTWAVWQDKRHRAAKAHVAFEVFGAGPVDATIGAATGSERRELAAELLQSGKVYVLDRGYESYELYARIHDHGSGFVARVQQDAAFEVEWERPISEAAAQAGVTRDIELKRLGNGHHWDLAKGKRMRMVVVSNPEARAEEPKSLVLVSDQMEWDAELVALAYRYRWTIELFFRWLKRILGCRHLLAQSADGVAIQVYCALIASVLMTLWTGAKPNKRTFEMFCHLFSGWATEAEVEAHLKELLNRKTKAKRTPHSSD